MTVLENLALNVDHVQIFGSAGEPEFGSPRILEAHDDIKQWMEGLRAGDGSGCVPEVLTLQPWSNVVQKCLEAEERKKNSPRTRGKLCDRDARSSRGT